MTRTEPATLGRRLAEQAARGIVGREPEIALFDQLLAPPLPALALLWLHGPGGIGKSTLLARLREHTEAGGRRAAFVDAALLQPSPAAFLAELGDDDPRRTQEPGVLFIDTVEHLLPLLGWLRRDFLTAVPATWLVVVAGRRPPPEEWAADAAWAGLMRVHALPALGDAAARALLAARGVPEHAQAGMLEWARGHPLALALMADTAARSALAATPDGPASALPAGADDARPAAQAALVQSLVERFARELPPSLRRALLIAALSRHTTEPLLADVLGADAAHEAFEALRALSFMRTGPHGLAPHELVREVLVADAQWRDAVGAQRLVRAIVGHHYRAMVQAPPGRMRLHQQAEALFTQRHAAHKSAYFAWDEFGQHRVEHGRPQDWPLLEAMVRRHEGDAALRWLAHWWRRQPEGFRLFWRDDGVDRCDGFLLLLRLDAQTPRADRDDPAVASAWRFVASQRPLAGDDELVLLRSWMHAERHQAVSAAINLTSMHVVSHLIAHPVVAWNVVWMADPEFWRPHFEGVNWPRCPAADHVVGDRRFGAFVHDWRHEPAEAWIAGDYRAMRFARPAPRPPRSDDEPASAAAGDADLAEANDAAAEFNDAVRQALREATDVPALARGALAARLGLDGPALQARLREVVDALAAHPRDAKFRDALWHTYIEPMHKQEQVAAELGVPFPTYRYRLQQGVERVAARLRRSA